jgi:hypothetical protein
MATMVKDCTTKGQHSVVQFLWAKGLNANVVNKEMFPVCDEKCF